MRIAVVIPTLNEAATLGATLDSLHVIKDPLLQIVVADGGSVDSTATLAAQRGARVIVTPRTGRGCQIADALRQVTEDVILIIHADMIVPLEAPSIIRRFLATRPDCPGGCLGHRFDSPRRLFRLIECWDSVRARTGCSYGDQAQFFRRDLLESHGGFPDQSIMEDIELHRRLKRLGRPVYIDFPVIVSARRFERLGWWRTVIANLGLRFGYRIFGSRACRVLYRGYYGDVPQSRRPATTSS